MYAASLSNEDVLDITKQWNFITVEHINSKIDNLVKLGLIDEDRKSLTDLGRTSLKVVLAGGVFDIIHPGHIYTLNAAKALGDILVVVVATDKTAQKIKQRKPLHDQKQRQDLVNSLSMVDICTIGFEGDIFKTVERVRPETIIE